MNLDFLPQLGFGAPHLVLSLVPDAGGTMTQSAVAAASFTVGPSPAMVLVEHRQADDTLLLNAAFPQGLSLASLTALAELPGLRTTSIRRFDLPPDVPRGLASLMLRGLQLVWSQATASLSSAWAEIEIAPAWQVVPGQAALRRVRARFSLNRPPVTSGHWQVHTELAARLEAAQMVLDVTVSVPELVATAAVDISPALLVGHLAGADVVAPDGKVRLYARCDIRRHTFMLAFALRENHKGEYPRASDVAYWIKQTAFERPDGVTLRAAKPNSENWSTAFSKKDVEQRQSQRIEKGVGRGIEGDLAFGAGLIDAKSVVENAWNA
ncbi:hypothetical protein [Streptomyces sp. CBMA152]|uniref:hypothetical protein n=1 Tax=Streptomyces sp. CBMA152 TaxID=1896312 RepID=UPI0016604729|nr:hypothetical protein [Streptomyces sp. CBMA152]MBD0743024.1 hypothetical protein [Streptomyces sp. CBMA152]